MSEFITCPYCKRELRQITGGHLKTHGKTLKEVREEFPGFEISTKELKDKIKKAVLEKYGTTCSLHNPIVKEKVKKTIKDKYNVEHVLQAKEVKQKIKETNLKKYGSEEIGSVTSVREKAKNTMVTKYGNANPSLIEEFKNKREKTFTEKYGSHPWGNKQVIEKRKKDFESKYGFDNPLKLSKIKEKIKETCKTRYGQPHPPISEKTRKSIAESNKKKFLERFKQYIDILDISLVNQEYVNATYEHEWKCNKCNEKFVTQWNYIQQGFKCPICYPRNIGCSVGEKQLREFIEGLGLNIIYNDRKLISPFEIDILIPEIKIAVEYCGLYWHSEEYRDNVYHLNKLEKCREKNYFLITIFEDEWVFKRNLVEERLKNIFKKSRSTKINARDCEIKEISPRDKNIFLEKFHIQGSDKSKIKLGAFYKNELVSVMTFSHGNISKGSHYEEGVWELNRFCSNYNYHIPGVASKLIKYFERNYKWNTIFSYADRRWSEGNLYYKLGFDLKSITKPNYWYIKNTIRIHRFNLRKRRDEPKEISESVLRAADGYLKIWDCGNLKFIKVNEINI